MHHPHFLIPSPFRDIVPNPHAHHGYPLRISYGVDLRYMVTDAMFSLCTTNRLGFEGRKKKQTENNRGMEEAFV
jgi:hypothetical protein